MLGKLIPFTTNSLVQHTNVTNIFIPHGNVIYNTDYATLKLSVNVTSLYEETKQVCKVSRIIKAFIKERAANVKMSAPNIKILSILVHRIHNLCQDDMNTMLNLKSSFGLINLENNVGNGVEKRQIVILTAIVSSLVTYFTTKQLVAMSTNDDEDQLIDSTNHIITALKDHETRITRMEERQKQLNSHLKVLTKSLVLGIRTQDIFASMYATSTYAGDLSQHVRNINTGLYALMQTGRLHPNLVNSSSLAEGINRLRKKALKNSKELILENNADLFQLKSDFVAFPNGQITVLCHIPLIDLSSKLKLYKFVSAPIHIEKNGYQFLIDQPAEEFLAVNNDLTLYTNMESVDQCSSMRDIKVCNNLNILKKVGTNGGCLVDLFMNNLEAAKTSCTYRIRHPTEFAVRLSNEQVYLYAPNKTILTEKCLDELTSNKIEIEGANILTIEAGCRVQSSGYIFKRNKEIFTDEISPILIDSIGKTNIWDLISKNAENENIKNLLHTMVKKNAKGLKLADIEDKFNLHKLRHRNKVTQNVFTSISSIILLIGGVLIIYVCRNNLSNICARKSSTPNRIVGFNPVSDTTSISWIPSSVPLVANLQDLESCSGYTNSTISQIPQEPAISCQEKMKKVSKKSNRTTKQIK